MRCILKKRSHEKKRFSLMTKALTCNRAAGHTFAPSGHILRRRTWTRLPCNQSASRRSSSFLLCDSWCRRLLWTTRAFQEHIPPWRRSSQQSHCAQCLQSSISLQRNVFCLTCLPRKTYSRMGAELVCREDPCPDTSSSRAKKDRDPWGAWELEGLRSGTDTSSTIGCRSWPSTRC